MHIYGLHHGLFWYCLRTGKIVCCTMYSMFLRTFMLTVAMTATVSGKDLPHYRCGKDMQYYDSMTEKCVNGKVQPIGRHLNNAYTYTCGVSMVQYDVRTHTCYMGMVKSKTKPATTPIATSPIKPKDKYLNMPSQILEKIPIRNSRRLCRNSTDVLDCNGKLYCGHNVGYRCCGFNTYHPKRQTCCQTSGAKFRRHDGNSEETHICCDLEIYRRGSLNAACQHTSSNDKFFEKPRSLKPKRIRYKKLCTRQYKYVIRVSITDQWNVLGHQPYLHGDIAMWEWSTTRDHRKGRISRSPDNEAKMEISLDKYSPKADITKKTFLIFTSYRYLDDAVFFLRREDSVYHCPKNIRKIAKKLRKIWKKCRRFNIKHG